ncbi:hypothetical protein ACOMHN_006209 [Nucella lapillus]
MCVQRLLRIPSTQRVFEADPKDTINAACGEQFLRILPPWDFTLWTHRLLRIPSTQRVFATDPKDTINAACGEQFLRIPRPWDFTLWTHKCVCAATTEDVIDAACVCSGSCGFHRRGVCVQRFLRILSTRRVFAAAPEDTIDARILRIPSTQHVCAASLEVTINVAYVCSGSLGYNQRGVCAESLKDTIDAAFVCSGF